MDYLSSVMSNEHSTATLRSGTLIRRRKLEINSRKPGRGSRKGRQSWSRAPWDRRSCFERPWRTRAWSRSAWARRAARAVNQSPPTRADRHHPDIADRDRGAHHVPWPGSHRPAVRSETSAGPPASAIRNRARIAMHAPRAAHKHRQNWPAGRDNMRVTPRADASEGKKQGELGVVRDNAHRRAGEYNGGNGN